MNIKPSHVGWIVTKNGKPYKTPDVSKHMLLVGYDMGPLLGLRKAEKNLRTPPYDIRRVMVKYSPNSPLFGASIRCRINLEAAAFSNIHDSDERTRMSTAFFLESNRKFKLTDEQRQILRNFYYFDRDSNDPKEPKDKRRRISLRKLREDVGVIFDKLKVRIVPILYELLDD